MLSVIEEEMKSSMRLLSKTIERPWKGKQTSFQIATALKEQYSEWKKVITVVSNLRISAYRNQPFTTIQPGYNI